MCIRDSDIRAQVDDVGDPEIVDEPRLGVGGQVLQVVRTQQPTGSDHRAVECGQSTDITQIGQAREADPADLVHGLDPVSYTHLDVYKRQVSPTRLCRTSLTPVMG